MTFASLLQDFRGKVVRGAAHGSPTNGAEIALRDEQGSESEVSHFDIHILIQKQIARLQVSMHNVALVQVFDCAACLNHESSNLRHSKELSLLDCISEGAIRAYFEHHVGTEFERECAVEFNDVWMRELGVDLELGHKLKARQQQVFLVARISPTFCASLGGSIFDLTIFKATVLLPRCS